MTTMKTETEPAEKVSATENEKGKTKNKKNSPVGIIVSALLFALLLAVDLVGKHCAVKYLTVGKSVEVIKGVFSLTLIYNKGMAFGLLSDTLAGMIIVTAVTVIIMAFIIVAYVKTGFSRTGLKVILAVIEAGAVGNLVDRVLMFTGNLTGVRDFLDISSLQFFSFINGGFNFGICNPADFCVTLGGVALVIYLIFAIGSDSEKEDDGLSPAADRSEIFKEEYVEKDVSSLEEIPFGEEAATEKTAGAETEKELPLGVDSVRKEDKESE